MTPFEADQKVIKYIYHLNEILRIWLRKDAGGDDFRRRV